MSKTVALNQTDVFVMIRVLDDSDGTPKTDMVAATTGHEMWYWREGAAAVVTDSTSAADMTNLNDSHTDWEFKHFKDGWYWCAFPDAAFAEDVGQTIVGMNATGFTGISVAVTIEPAMKFHGQAASVTATTTTFPAGTDPYKGDRILVSAGTGIKGEVLVSSVSGQVATHPAFPVGISATTSTILLIAGTATDADGGLNADAAVSSRSTLTEAEANAQTDTALGDYFDALKNAGGTLQVDVLEINETTVLGDGTSGDKWRGS